MTISPVMRSVVDLSRLPKLPTAFTTVYDIKIYQSVSNPPPFPRTHSTCAYTAESKCIATPELERKYQVAQDNTQTIISVTDKLAHNQTWYNSQRSLKPITFVTTKNASTPHDPTAGGKHCDFCKWQQYTAQDCFGRAERTHAVTASNLFKYVAPAQGVVLFKDHDPLQWDFGQFKDLVDCSEEWFQRAYKQNYPISSNSTRDGVTLPSPSLYPLFVWNCLGRAGASQFHGHAQLMLSHTPYPALSHQYDTINKQPSYWQDVAAAHASVELTINADAVANVTAFPSICPWKDSEIVVLNGADNKMTNPGFQKLLYAAMRTLIDELGINTFNVAMYNMRGIGEEEKEKEERGGGGEGLPLVARIVGRGKVSSAASDFGGLEVFGQASIAHNDPYLVSKALKAQVALLMK